MRKIHLKRALMTRKFVILTLVLDNDCCMSRNVGRTKTLLRRINCIFYDLDYDVNMDLPIDMELALSKHQSFFD